MWKSWGDRYEIVPYDKERRPRNFKYSYIVVIILLVITFCVNTFSFSHILPQTTFGKFIPAVVTLFSAIAFLVLFLIKWKKNDRECDLALIFAAVLLFVVAYIASPLW
jgi:uncharacterized membrane-anchored protein